MKRLGYAAMFLLSAACLVSCGARVDSFSLRGQSRAAYLSGNYPQAESLLTQALAMDEKEFGKDDPRIVENLTELGKIYSKEGRVANAVQSFDRAVKIRETQIRPGLLALSESLDGLGNAYLAAGKNDQADSLLRQSLQLREENLPALSPSIAESDNSLAPIYYRAGDYGQAESLYGHAISIYEQSGGDKLKLDNCRNNLASLYVAEGKNAQAEPLLKAVLADYENAYGPNHPEVAVVLNNLAELTRREKQYNQAEAYCRRALSIYESNSDLVNSPYYATVLNNLALVYDAQYHAADAEALYKRAIAVLEANFDQARLTNVLSNYCCLLHKTRRDADAQKIEMRIQQLVAMR